MLKPLLFVATGLATAFLLEFIARTASGQVARWARGVLLWSGMLWTALALIGLGEWVFSGNINEPDSPAQLVGASILTSLCIGGSFFTGGFLAERLGARFRWKTWTTQALALLTTAPSVFAGYTLLQLIGWLLMGVEPFWMQSGLGRAFSGITIWFVTSAAVFAGVVRLLYTLRLENLEAEHAQLAAESTSARLAQLEARLRPHFLLNALSGLAGLIHEAPDRAEAMTLALARLLRHSLDASDAPTVPLRDDLALVRAYLDVEQPRFGERLQVTFNVEDAMLNALVPRLTLQPLVENAIKHGLGQTDRAVHITVIAQHGGPHLQLAVADNGPAFPDDLTGGHGLTSVTERLMLLYGDRFTLQFVNATPGNMKHVRIALPYTPAVPALAR